MIHRSELSVLTKNIPLKMLRHKTWTENEGEKKQPVSKDEL